MEPSGHWRVGIRIGGPHSVTSHSSALPGADPEADPAGSGVEVVPEPDPDLGGDVWRPQATARHRIETMRSMPQRTSARARDGALPATGPPGGAARYWPLYSSISSAPEAKLPHVALYFAA